MDANTNINKQIKGERERGKCIQNDTSHRVLLIYQCCVKNKCEMPKKSGNRKWKESKMHTRGNS